MRYIIVTVDHVVDSDSGESLCLSQLEAVLTRQPGGIIAGTNMYATLVSLERMVRSDHGWTLTLDTQVKSKVRTGRIGGMPYFKEITYRFPKCRTPGKDRTRRRPPTIKWLILNLELFHETDNILESARALVGIADRRGIRPRYSPGSFGSALLRASPAWPQGRPPAPWFISEKARQYLPGNYYALRSGYQFRTIPRAYYLDQTSAHHTIAATIALPHPAFLRMRSGTLRAIKRGRYSPMVKGENVDRIYKRHVGLLCAIVECDTIPLSEQHLYPPWAKVKGRHIAWVWTPELRLLDRRIRLCHVACALTSYEPDPVLSEYARWALEQLADHKHPAIKPALLAAYGMLGVRSDRKIEHYTVSGRPKPPRADTVTLPLMGPVFRSTVKSTRVPSTQNIVARGVIEAETRTRSIEYARELEAQGIIVSQIYADGLIALTDQLPFLPEYWRVHGELTNLRSPAPNSIVSDEMVRIPGVPGGRRESEIKTRESKVVV